MTNISVIAWDFDGVLNRNIINGDFIWADTFEDDIGHSMDVFGNYIFRQNLHKIITGQEDLLDHVMYWAKDVGYKKDPQTILDYWFNKDALPDPMTLSLMSKLATKGYRQIIATNNETRRASFIENEMGFGRRVEKFFTSGRMGVAKPDPEYFSMVSSALEVAPSEIFFIDDMSENIEAAKRCGWKTFHFTESSRNLLKYALPT